MVSGRAWCSVYKSLTGWLLAGGHVGWMDVWGEEGKARQTLKFPLPLEKLIRLVWLTLLRSRDGKLAELLLSKFCQDKDVSARAAVVAWRTKAHHE